MTLKTEYIQLELKPGQRVPLKDFTIPTGQKVLIEGPSGCGKTSLLHTLGLLRRPTEGQVFYNGTPVEENLDHFRRKNFGFIFQRLSLIEHLTIQENILLDEVSSIHPEILNWLELENRSDELVGPLSLGEQQRVAIARALHKNPAALFADEPTSSLDRPLAERVGKALTGLSKSTVVVVSHDERIIPFFDRVISWKDLLA